MSNQIVITSGAKVRELNDVIIGTSGVLSSLAFNVANGVPKLDSNAKILVSQLPNSVMEYQGTWNAATNTPTLTNGGAFNQGDVYLCNVAGTTNFGAGPISFIVGDSAIYSGSIWQRSGGATGSVTSVGLSTDGNAITIGSSPITTSGTITANFAGTSGQYINGAGNLTTFPTLLSSVGLSMPSAFSVSNSPLTSNGTIAVTGAGYPSQYIRGDGTLADFPTSGGGGSSVSYYLNGGTSQGVIGGVTYYEMSKTADTGTGADFPKSGDGLIVSFLTDAGDPAQLNIPAGNWNYEIYASMSSNGGTPQMYAELYVYDGTTFTLISTSSNEILYDGVNLNLYTFAMTVPSTTLTLTDRLAIKLYAINSGGKTTTVHTQDSHLCQIITTFSTGITALNGLTAQVQYFATGTSGTDFNISSSTATHTFNIPDASATARGLITTGTQTIAGAKTFSSGVTSSSFYAQGNGTQGGYLYLKQGTTPYSTLTGSNSITADSTKYIFYSDAGSSNGKIALFELGSLTNNTNRTYTLPDASGTLALTSQLVAYLPLSGGFMSGNIYLNNNIAISGQLFGTTSYSSMLAMSPSNKVLIDNGSQGVIFGGTIGQGAYTYNLPTASGTLALTSDIPSLANYVTLTTTQTISGAKTFTSDLNAAKVAIANSNTLYTTTGYTTLSASNVGTTSWIAYNWGNVGGAAAILAFNNTAQYTYTFPASTGTIVLTSNLSSYIPYTGTGISVIGLSAIGEYDGGAQIPAGYGGSYALTLGNGAIGNGLSLYTTGYINAGAITTAGFSRVTNATASTSTTTGAFVVTGGVGIGGALYGTSATFSSSVSTNTLFKGRVGSSGVGFETTNGVDADFSIETVSGGTTKIGTSGNKLAINSGGGNVLIGTTTDIGAKLYVNGVVGFGTYSSSVKLYTKSDTANSSSYALGCENGSVNLFLVRGDGLIETGLAANSPYNFSTTGRTPILSSGGILGYLVSTRESKANIETINSIDFINNLNPVQFNYRKKDDKTNTFTDELETNITYGFIADEVEKVNKELVFYNEDGTLAGVEYNSMIAILTKAVQEQQAQIEELSNKIVALESK